MEAGGGVSAAPALCATPEGPEDGSGGCSPELPSTDPGRLQALPIGPGAHRAAPAQRSPEGQTAVSRPGEQSCPAKIPNRDSGIDSPTRSRPAGPFSCQEGSEAGGPSLLALHPEAAPGSKTTQKEANSDMGQDSGQEPVPENSLPGACADLAKVGCPPAQDGAPPGCLSGSGLTPAWCLYLGACSDTTFAEAPGRVWGGHTQLALVWSLAACLSRSRATTSALGLLSTLQGREEGTHTGHRMGRGGKGAGGAGGAPSSGLGSCCVHSREPRAGLTESPSASR